MRRSMPRALLLALGFALVGGAAPRTATAAGPQEVKINQVDASAYPAAPIKIYVSVTDNQGDPLKALTKDAFRLTLDGQPLVISAMQGSADTTAVPTPIQLVLAMDTSRNMRGEPLEKARAAAIQFIDQLRPGDKVALWKFEDKPEQVQTFTDNRDVLKDRLGRLTAGTGLTALNDTLFTISRAVMERQGRRALIVVTQGRNSSTSAKGNLMGGLAAAVDAQAPAYMLGFGQVDEESLATIARETGGEFLREPAADGVGKLFTQLKELLQGQYELQADIPVDKVDGKTHSFGIEAQVGGKNLKGVPKDIIIVQVMPIPAIVRTLTARANLAVGTPGAPGSTLPPGASSTTNPQTSSLRDNLPLILGLIGLALLVWYFMRGSRTQQSTGGSGYGGPTVVDSPPGGSMSGGAGGFGAGGFGPGGFGDIGPSPKLQTGGPSSGGWSPGGPVDPAGGLAGGTVIMRPIATGILVGIEGPLAGQQHEFVAKSQGPAPTWEIGREGPQDVVLNDATVSRRHAKLKWEWEGQGAKRRGHFVIYDLAASNPVEVNGKVVVTQKLNDGDKVKLGGTTFVFKQVEIQAPGAGR